MDQVLAIVIKVGGILSSLIRFADDIVFTAKIEYNLQKILGAMFKDLSNNCYNLINKNM